MQSKSPHISFRQFVPEDLETLSTCIKSLYSEDPGSFVMTDEKIRATIDMLSRKPELGYILIPEREGQIAGYALIIHFWSNEYGGFIEHIDELYIIPQFRNQGIATALFHYLICEKNNSCVAIKLEVRPENEKAYRLYQRIGFKPAENHNLVLKLS